MGLGKTVQVIAYLATVPHRQTGMPSLVVCPTSLILNWGDELARFAHQLRAALLLGPACLLYTSASIPGRRSSVSSSTYAEKFRTTPRIRYRSASDTGYSEM